MRKSSIIISRRAGLSAPAFLGVSIAALLLAAWLGYELGLSRAGYLRFETSRTLDQLEDSNAGLISLNKRLSEQVAILETAAKVEREAYRHIEAEIAELQNKILAQQENIEFYRGIVNENGGSVLRIQDFRVLMGSREHEYELRLVLARALRSNREVSGQVELIIEGLQRGAPVQYALDEVSLDGSRLRYEFLYFEDLRSIIALPAEFQPERVHLLVRPKGKSAKIVDEFFVWQPETG